MHDVFNGGGWQARHPVQLRVRMVTHGGQGRATAHTAPRSHAEESGVAPRSLLLCSPFMGGGVATHGSPCQGSVARRRSSLNGQSGPSMNTPWRPRKGCTQDLLLLILVPLLFAWLLLGGLWTMLLEACGRGPQCR